MAKKIMQWMLILLLANSTAIIAATHQAKLPQQINTIIKQYNLPATVGVLIQSMKTGKILYAQNSNQLYVPASNLKLFTAAAALLYLGSDYQFKTTISTDARNISNNSVLEGNVYLKFSGDPDLSIEQMNNLILGLKQANITTIQGNFYIDRQTYNDKKYASGWMWDELNFCYAAPITAIMINHNCFSATLTPAEKIDEPAKLAILNDNNLVSINNQVRTMMNANCSPDLKAMGNNNYNLTGCMLQHAQPLNLQIAIRDPDLYAKNLIKVLLAANHIQLQGNISYAAAPANLMPLATEDSKSLKVLVTEMLKQSDNQIANSLLMTLGEKYYQQPATWKNGVMALQAILSQRAGIDFAEANIVDGAGISRYDLVTPQQISKLLYFAYHNATIAPVFIAALPIAGEDGTLKSRMLNKNIQGKLMAKTGSMTGVSALSGYVTTTNKQTLSFVILINNFLADNAEQAEKLEDQIGGVLVSRAE